MNEVNPKIFSGGKKGWLDFIQVWFSGDALQLRSSSLVSSVEHLIGLFKYLDQHAMLSPYMD